MGGGDRRIKEVLSYRETNNRVNYDRRTERNILRKPSLLSDLVIPFPGNPERVAPEHRAKAGSSSGYIMCLCLTSRNGPPSQCYSATRSLKIRLPEFTLTAWVRDGRLDFHAKPAPNVGGRIFNEPAYVTSRKVWLRMMMLFDHA
jgi:hypothetical protein